jgi:hypothetical protein
MRVSVGYLFLIVGRSFQIVMDVSWMCHGCVMDVSWMCPLLSSQLLLSGVEALHILCSAFTDEVKRNCSLTAPGRNCYNIGKLILLFYGAILDSYQENLVALSGESCSIQHTGASPTLRWITYRISCWLTILSDAMREQWLFNSLLLLLAHCPIYWNAHWSLISWLLTRSSLAYSTVSIVVSLAFLLHVSQ